MILYADAAGALIRVTTDADQDAKFGPPDVYAESLEIDPDTNPQIVAALMGRLPNVLWQDIRLLSGVLSYKGTVTTVNPPGPAWQAQVEAEDAKAHILEAIDGALADYAAVLAHWDALTQAQLKAVVKRNTEVLVQLLRYHRRELL